MLHLEPGNKEAEQAAGRLRDVVEAASNDELLAAGQRRAPNFARATKVSQYTSHARGRGAG